MNSNTLPPSKQQNQNNIEQSFSNLQAQCSNLLHNVSQAFNPNYNNNPNIFSSLNSFRDQAKQALDSGISRFNSVSHSGNAPIWAKISNDGGGGGGGGAKTQVTDPVSGTGGGGKLSAEERLAGVPVYALSNSNEEFVLVSGTSTGKSLGLLFCKEEDAETLLKQMKSMDPRMRKEGSKVVALALSKVKELAFLFLHHDS